jgi:hypothetical protein
MAAWPCCVVCVGQEFCRRFLACSLCVCGPLHCTVASTGVSMVHLGSKSLAVALYSESARSTRTCREATDWVQPPRLMYHTSAWRIRCMTRHVLQEPEHANLHSPCSVLWSEPLTGAVAGAADNSQPARQPLLTSLQELHSQTGSVTPPVHQPAALTDWELDTPSSPACCTDRLGARHPLFTSLLH